MSISFLTRRLPASSKPFTPRLLECSNDIEKNPGPTKGSKNQIISKLRGGKSSTRKEMNPSESEESSLKAILEEQSHALQEQRAEIEALKRGLASQSNVSLDFASELSEIRRNWTSLNGTETREVQELGSKVDSLSALLNDIQDRLYELDKSWKNNLVLFGVPGGEDEEDLIATLDKVREVFHKKLYISRDIPMSRISRINYGPDFRGHKPILLCLVNYRDKEELLRKSRLLKGTNIYLSEDYSRKVREHRHELIKFMKEVRTRDPARRMNLRYDKLYMGHDVFFFNDRNSRVEKMQTNIEAAGNATFTASLGNLIINDSQNSLQHEYSWSRRPRSRIASRCHTPLSMSMEDLPTTSDNLPPISYHGIQRIPSSANSRHSSPSKAYSYHREYPHTEPSARKSASKSVGFKNVPVIDKETPRMLNGTPHHNPFPRSAEQLPEEEVVLTVIKNEEVGQPELVADKAVIVDPEDERKEPVESLQAAVVKTEEKILPPLTIENGVVSSLETISSSSVSSNFKTADPTIFPAINSGKLIPYEQQGLRESALMVPYSKYESSNGCSSSSICLCKTSSSSSSSSSNGKIGGPLLKQIEYSSGRGANGKMRSQCSCSGETGVIKVAMFGEFSMSNIQSKNNTNYNFSNSN